MGQSYAKNKVHILNWNAKNPDKKRELSRINQRRYDEWYRIKKIFLNILL